MSVYEFGVLGDVERKAEEVECGEGAGRDDRQRDHAAQQPVQTARKPCALNPLICVG